MTFNIDWSSHGNDQKTQRKVASTGSSFRHEAPLQIVRYKARSREVTLAGAVRRRRRPRPRPTPRRRSAKERCLTSVRRMQHRANRNLAAALLSNGRAYTQRANELPVPRRSPVTSCRAAARRPLRARYPIPHPPSRIPVPSCARHAPQRERVARVPPVPR